MASCLDLAESNPILGQKTRLLAMAEAWLELADRASRLAKGTAAGIAEHPTVTTMARRHRGAETE